MERGRLEDESTDELLREVPCLFKGYLPLECAEGKKVHSQRYNKGLSQRSILFKYYTASSSGQSFKLINRLGRTYVFYMQLI